MRAKKQSVVLWVIAILFAVLAAGIFLATRSNSQFVANYQIGDQGPAGGIIFYIDDESKFENFDYLEKINRGYLDYIKTQTDLNVLVIDVSDLDFVKKQEDYIFLLNEINKKI